MSSQWKKLPCVFSDIFVEFFYFWPIFWVHLKCLIPSQKKFKMLHYMLSLLFSPQKVCNKEFAHRESLVTHSSLHTGVKPYICECCGQKFSCVGNLIKHRRVRPQSCGLPKYTNAKCAPRASTKGMQLCGGLTLFKHS